MLLAIAVSHGVVAAVVELRCPRRRVVGDVLRRSLAAVLQVGGGCRWRGSCGTTWIPAGRRPGPSVLPSGARRCGEGRRAASRDRSHVPYEITNTHTQRVGDQLQRSQSHALLSAFEPVEMRAIQAGPIRELVLREALGLADLLDALGDHAMDVLQSLRLGAYAALKHPALKQVEL